MDFLAFEQMASTALNAYWPLSSLIAATTATAGPKLADFATRPTGIGYTGGSAFLLALIILSLAARRATLGTVSVDSVQSRGRNYLTAL